MEFALSQSKLRDFDEMCPMEFRAKYFTNTYPRLEPSLEMELGNFFETEVIGGGIKGAFNFDTSPHGQKIRNGVYYQRVLQQANDCKTFLKNIGGKVQSRQEYIKHLLVSPDGTKSMWIEGTLDIRFTMEDGQMVIIDLKFTGDAENDFGKFAWGTPEKMDLTQIVHYALLVKLKYSLDYIPLGYYWVFDKEKDLKKKLIRCRITEYTLNTHIDRLFKVHEQLSFNIAMDAWEPKNTWDNCSKCLAPCKYQRVIPEYYEIEL